jgi:hypothetical protein
MLCRQISHLSGVNGGGNIATYVHMANRLVSMATNVGGKGYISVCIALCWRLIITTALRMTDTSMFNASIAVNDSGGNYAQ